MAKGGTARVAAIEKLAAGVGGSLECCYFAFGNDDLYAIVDAPSHEAMAAIAGTVTATATATGVLKHRRANGKWVKYAKRVQHCVDLDGQPFLDLIVIDPEQWVERVVVTHDDLAHHREQFRVDGSVGDYLLAEQLFWLFAICLLRLADAPDTVYERISKHPHIRWLTERAHILSGDLP